MTDTPEDAPDAQGTTVRIAVEADMPAVLAIYNDAVLTTTATYDYDPRALDSQVAILREKERDGFAMFVAQDSSARILGFATYGMFRTRPGWRFACEHSVYVDREARGRGVGSLLMPPVMAHARSRGFHSMVGVIDAANSASIALHERFGFTLCGIMREGGFKFDRWLDVAFMQALL
jgi:L-amino acid N-acyltransferase YncA